MACPQSSQLVAKNSFKPNALRYSEKLAERACQLIASATHVGSIQALYATPTAYRI